VGVVIGARQAKRGDGLIIGGCGMDMGFHLVNSLSEALYGYLRCAACGKYHDRHPDEITYTVTDAGEAPGQTSIACRHCGAGLRGGYACLGPGKCPSNYHVNHRDRVHCEGTRVHNPDGPDFGERCYKPSYYRARAEEWEGWPMRKIDIGDGEQVDAGPLACIGDREAGTLQVCPTCQGAGDVPNPAGPERWDLLHTDGYALRHRWL
jgi:hypothetical protein